MMHSKRVWHLSEIPSAEELARMLTEQTWTLCSGFYVAGHPDHLFLNDSTSEDGAQEYAVVKGGRLGASHHLQIESITFSWCNHERALEHIARTLAGDNDSNDFARPVVPRLETPEEHGRCHHCA